MEKEKLDLSDRVNAEASRNKTALNGVLIMDVVLCLAYLLEVVKGARGLGSYALLAVMCMLPWFLAVLVYRKKKDSLLVRYITGLGFSIFYGYILFTTPSDLPFCYVLVIISIWLVYVDVKFSLGAGCAAIIVNIAVVIKKAVTVGLTPQDITNAEIIIACLLLATVFSILAISKVAQIGQANTDKAASEKKRSERLLRKTLRMAEAINANIEKAASETERLNDAIDATQRSMEGLTTGTNDTVMAIMEQQKSTNEIDGYIRGVETSANQIMDELDNAEENLNVGHTVMKDLLEQVKVSENSGSLVAKEMEGLKENADRMQDIIGLIGSVANQTALLSLNASIEAARAGEAGRGFSVVAGEISNLAAQTNTATGDINKLIESITLSIKEVTKAVEALLESNQFQNEYVAKTAENFDKIQNSTREISQQAGKLKETVDAVSVANAHVVQSIDNVSAVTEEVTASANETLNSCNLNLESIENLTKIMEELGEEARELQQD